MDIHVSVLSNPSLTDIHPFFLRLDDVFVEAWQRPSMAHGM